MNVRDFFILFYHLQKEGSTYEKIFELGDKLAHQNPAEGCEEFYMDKVYKMRDIQSDARYLTETNPKDIEKKLQELLIKAEKLVK